MDYNAFVSGLVGLLSQRLGEDCSVSVERIRKNNDIDKDTVTIHTKGSLTAPAIHLDQFYKRLQEGTGLEQIADEVVTCYRENMAAGELDMDFFVDWEKVKDRIVCRLIGAAHNRERLRTLVHRRVMDLAEIYYYLFETGTGASAGIAVRSEFLVQWGISEEELAQIAMRNTARLTPCSFQKMHDVMEQLLGRSLPQEAEKEQALYVLSNRQRLYGAWWMCDAATLERIGEEVGDDYLILPSSVHECMILPAGASIRVEEIAEMVQDINRTQVEPEEVLADSVYRYTRADGLQKAS